MYKAQFQTLLVASHGEIVEGEGKDELKVRWFQNDFWISSFEPKTEQKYYSISALSSKMGQKIKIMALYHGN